ncbi:hypothetical protein I6E52_08450 [Salinibacterium sp. NG253]|uniref:DUF6326 family protein n=1 Tax=Salinibacterium sp. NG253 TaxID=2792039 RepID=UPI0018CDD3A2|nr:DUF6326 family protein [Salinibacterium sp. NG253]MBH0116877.1 hypothetical protein [Salinibacterium sp. NG253]
MSTAAAPLPPLDTRIRLAALWTATMVLVAFVDIFGFYRPDYREQVEAGRVFVFDIGQPFMLGIVIYVMIPTLMIALSVLLPHRSNRLTNLIVAPVFALTIVGAAIGEWGYYVLASGVELALLATIVTLSVKWAVPKRS